MVLVNLADGRGTVETLDDGTRIQKTTDGTTLVIRLDGTKIQTKATGQIIHINPDGTKFQEDPDGSTLFVEVDGTHTKTHPNGLVMIFFADGSKRQTDQFGVIVEVAANGDRTQINIDGSKNEVRGERAFIHLIDGSILEVNPKTNAILRVERTASCPGAQAAVAETDAAKQHSLEQAKAAYNPNLTRHVDMDSGAWYEHDQLSGSTRWLTTEETEEQLRTDELARVVTKSRVAEIKIVEIETNAKKKLEDMQSQLELTKQRNKELESQVVELQADVQRRHVAHVESNTQYETHMQHTISQLKLSLGATEGTGDGTEQEELFDLRQKYSTLQMKHGKSTGELATTRGTLEAVKKRLESTRLTLRSTRKEVGDAIDAKRAMSRKYEEVVDRAGSLAEEMKGMQTTLDSSADTYAKSLHEIARLEVSLQQVTEQNNGMQSTGVGKVNVDKNSKLLAAAERMCEVTMKKMTSANAEVRQQRALLEEMQLRRESTDVLMRRQRTALTEAEEQNDNLRQDLQNESERHAIDNMASKENTEKLKDRLYELYEKYKNVEMTPKNNDEVQNIVNETTKAQSERIYNLADQLQQKDSTITLLRQEVSSLHKELSALTRKLESDKKGSAIAMDAISFFDMDALGLDKVPPPPPPAPSIPPSSPKKGSRPRVGSRARAFRMSRTSLRTSSGMSSFGSQSMDQDNVERLLTLRAESRSVRTNELHALLKE